ncbi:2-oxoglutarate and iron-dependent oxygenase domain-containing protein 3-like isoform X2 [Liolophura sinensis]|uniref:2-oxoglutarate and iron-dependent oxygenase domain-containing protein 3-like isoform X2 n=1 Tax=Liolophura sinensis TaxID=3198878 RepID=UPI0031582794
MPTAKRKPHLTHRGNLGDQMGEVRKRSGFISEKSCQKTTSLFFCVSLGTFGILGLGFLILIYTYLDYLQFGSSSLVQFAKQDATYERAYYEVPCSDDYKKETKFIDCLPKKCGRVVADNLLTDEESDALLRIGMKGLALGGSSGGASILDLHSGALSKGTEYINIFVMLKRMKEDLFTEEDFILYNNVKNRIHQTIAKEFNIPAKKLFLTKPTFYSRMTTIPAQTIHDEYWHPHVDKETYGSFHYTSLLYLTNYGKDFTGGRFIFVDKAQNMTVEPRKGRVSFFTSGSENLHHVEKVESGTSSRWEETV